MLTSIRACLHQGSPNVFHKGQIIVGTDDSEPDSYEVLHEIL